MAVDDTGDDVGEIVVRLAGGDLARLDERGDHGPVLGTGVGAGEQSILASERQGENGTLDDVAVDLDASVVEEQAQALPARQSVSDRLGEPGLLAEELELVAQPWLERLDERPAAFLADLAPLGGGTAADFGFDAVELGDARQRIAGDRRGTGRGKLVELATDMAPAEGQLHRVVPGHHLVAAVAIDLQDTREALEMSDHLLGLAVGSVDVGHTGRI